MQQENPWKLSKSELKVTQEVILGKSNREVAAICFITEKTVKFHLTNIYKKAGVKSRAQLIVKMLVSSGKIGGGNPPEAAIAPV